MNLLSFFLLLTALLSEQSEAIEYEEILVYNKAYVQKGKSKLVLEADGYFRYYPLADSINRFAVGIWEEEADSIEFTFKEHRVSIIDQALECNEYDSEKEGIIIKFQLAIYNRVDPTTFEMYRQLNPIRRSDMELYMGSTMVMARTDDYGLYQNKDITEIDSIIIRDVFDHELLVLKDFSSQSDSIHLILDYPTLSRYSSNMSFFKSSRKAIEGKWAINGRFLAKRGFNGLVKTYRRIKK